MKIQQRTYRLTGQTRILGAQPANPDVRSEFIASKAATLAKGDEETDMLPDAENLEKKNLTVFLRDGDDGALCLCDYVIKGFLKEALAVLKSEIGILAPASKVDNFIKVDPAYLRFTRSGQPITGCDVVFERPLRAMTMQGPRTSVTASETINPGWQLDFTISLIENTGTPKSRALTFDAIESALDYGDFKGLGQWRNAQNGRFTWERIK